MSADQKTLTFFYDTKRHTRSGTTWGINEKRTENSDFPAWAGTYQNPNTTTTKGVIDESFKDFRPTSTAYWFVYYQKLNTIEGLQHLNTSEVTDMEGTFGVCKSLTALDLSRFNTDKVTNMLNLFAGCNSLTALDLSSFNTHNVGYMNHMFADCEALKEINLKNFNTAQVIDMSGMFKGCKALTALDLSSFNTEKVRDMGFMFSDCYALEKLDLSNFKTEEVREMNWMFYKCSALKELDLSNFKTEKMENVRWMFEDCSALTTIYCPNTWQCEKSADMFKNCTKLQGAVKYDASKVDVTMANPTTGYFTKTKPTAIEQMFLNAHKAKGIYTLQGKRINGSVEHLPAGVYIVNGKKVVVR